MKLISCSDCQDVVALTRWKKSCKCGKVYGKYIDNIHAKVSPGAKLLAIDSQKVHWISIINDIKARKINLIDELVYWEHDGTDITFEEFDE